MSVCRLIYTALTSRPPNGCASIVQTEMSLEGAWKQLRWSLDCRQGPEDCSRPTDQQWQKPGAVCADLMLNSEHRAFRHFSGLTGHPVALFSAAFTRSAASTSWNQLSSHAPPKISLECHETVSSRRQYIPRQLLHCRRPARHRVKYHFANRRQTKTQVRTARPTKQDTAR